MGGLRLFDLLSRHAACTGVCARWIRDMSLWEIQETKMPYQNRAELPESVRAHLPAHAQDIYKEAFNSAWDEYGHDESRAHRVAWGAVERKYHKDPSGKWVEGATEDTTHR
jgi:cation transport regulator